MSWLNGVIGQGIASTIGTAGCQAQQSYGYSQAQAQQAQMAQQAYGGLMGQGQMNAGSWSPPKWMFNGETMSFMDFVNKIFPEDTAEKTAFVLKYSEGN